MQTKYFKNMFQNISQGVMYSTGVADSETKNSWVACYICAGENEESLEFKAEKWKRGNHPSAYGICEKESCGAGDSSWKP